MNSQFPLLQLPDQGNPTLTSPLSKGDLIDFRSPKSNNASSSSSLTSSASNISDLLVGSREDIHNSPSSLSHNRPKPGLVTFEVSKSDTESNRYHQESFKIQNDSSLASPGLIPDERKSLDLSKQKPGIVKRNSRFSESRRGVSKGSKHSIEDIPANMKQRLSIDGEILTETQEVPAAKTEVMSPRTKSGFFKKRRTMILNPAQIELLDQKIFRPSVKQRTRSFSSGVDKGRVRRSKLLQRISHIAARGSAMSNNEPENPAYIFKQLLVYFTLKQALLTISRKR